MDAAPVDYARLAQILNRVIGLDTASIGVRALASAVGGRMAARGLASAEAYAGEVEANPLELRALIEAVVVPETWFFRDREAFSALGELGRQRAGLVGAAGRLRLISLPCSTGEEPYSLAMTLLDAGLPPAAFEIHAFDVSRAAIERALAGVYGRNSFRGDDLDFRSRHFVRAASGWRIRPEVADCVRFSEGNLLEIGASTAPASYDVVFCRNLLIYFDAESQRRAIRALGGLLKADGLLFVGPGDANLVLNAGFASVQRPLTFCFRQGPADQPAQPAARPARRTPPKAIPPQAAPARRPFSNIASAPPAAAPAEAQPPTGLSEAQRLADLGRIGEAVRACEAELRQGAASVAAWRLLGVLREAENNPSRAVDCYRKALYLDPADAETLDHLALLLQRQGDVAGAGRVRERARRLNAAEER